MITALVLALLAGGPTDPNPDLKSLTNAQLIALLPPARQETTRDVKAGSWVESPASKEWAERIITPGKVTPEEIAAAVKACAVLRSSPTCIEGQPYHVWLRMPAWLPGEKAVAVAHLADAQPACAREKDGNRADCGNAIAGREERESFQTIGVLPAGTDHVDFTLTLTPSKIWGGPSITQSIDITLPVELLPAGFTITPNDSPELTALVRRHVILQFSNLRDTAFFNNWMYRPPTGPLANTLVRINLELLKDGVPVWSHTCRDPDDLYGEAAWEHGDDMFISGCAAEESRRLDTLFHYAVRVSGAPPEAETLSYVAVDAKQRVHYPNQWSRRNYWSGQYTLPLVDTMERSALGNP